MRQEWREFWYYCRIKSSSILLSLGIALLFYLAQLPSLAPERRWLSFKISLIYGFVIYVMMWISYSIMWAWNTHLRIRTGSAFRAPSMLAHTCFGMTGVTAGMLISCGIESWLMGEPFDLTGFLTEIRN
jgi:hypothetical protein